MAKNNQKCVRLSDEVLSIIDNYRGKGFNEKFENFVLDSNKLIPKREEKLNRLNKDIALKESRLRELISKISQTERISLAIDGFVEQIQWVSKI